jgi:K+-sensing histidine kinase KdpD
LPRRLLSSASWVGRLGTAGRYGLALGMVTLSTGAAQFLYMLTNSNRIGTAFSVGVLVTSYLVGSGPGYLAAVISFVIYNLYVGGGHFRFVAYSAEDYLVLSTFPVLAMLMGNLTGRVRDEAKRAEARTTRR